jgi:hypothetical protein
MVALCAAWLMAVSLIDRFRTHEELAVKAR